MDRGHLAQDRTTRIEEMHSDALIQIQTGDCRRQYCQARSTFQRVLIARPSRRPVLPAARRPVLHRRRRCPGLCIRVTPKGIKTFAFAYRNKGTGKVAWLTLGRYPDVPLAQARELANDARKTAALGGTPLTPKVQRAEAEKKTKTYAEVVDLYFDAKLTMLRTGHKARQTLQRIGRVYGWNERPLLRSPTTMRPPCSTISRTGAARSRWRTRPSTSYTRCFKWAKQPGRKFVTVNPFADLPAPGGAIVMRDRFLSTAEIRQVWRALDAPERFKVSRDAATALRLILTTAARPGMVGGMTGAELRDVRGPSEHGPHWSLPAERMKAGSAFITPLSGLALELLAPAPQG